MNPEKSERFEKMISALRRKTKGGDIEWEKSDDPWSPEGGFDASLARSSFELRKDSDDSITLKIFDGDGLVIATLQDDDSSSLAAIADLYEIVRRRAELEEMRKIERIIEDIESTETPPPF